MILELSLNNFSTFFATQLLHFLQQALLFCLVVLFALFLVLRFFLPFILIVLVVDFPTLRNLFAIRVFKWSRLDFSLVAVVLHNS